MKESRDLQDGRRSTWRPREQTRENGGVAVFGKKMDGGLQEVIKGRGCLIQEAV
jgi:hypothetical protein